MRHRDNKTALALLVEVIKLKPEFYEAWIVRGNVLHAMDNHFEALLHYDRALSIKDTVSDAWNNRGMAFGDIGMYAEAELSFRRSISILDAVEPHMGLANMYVSIMRLQDGVNEYHEAIKINPGLFDARFNLGVTLLGQGNWDEGFSEYEWRWQNTPYPPRAYRNYPKWRGEDLTGKRILLYPEQGYGDEILALRFANTIVNKYDNSYVIVQARSPMFQLAKCMQLAGKSSIAVVAMNDDTEWRADFSCPLLDVPMVLGLGPDSVICDPYLSAPYGTVDEPYDWHRRLAEIDGLKVGVCWSSGGHLETAKAAQLSKSIKLEWLRGLAVPGVSLVSLQKPQLPIPADFPIIDWMDECHDFRDTAALIDCLDVVVSVDTAVAHLAGAMGKETYNLVRYSGYWPWLAPDVAPSPAKAIWYPSMTLLRQPSLHNWQKPLEDLQKIIEAKVT